MSGFRDGFAYKSPYIVGLFPYTHCIPSGNTTTTSDLWQRETRTFVGPSYGEIVRSQKENVADERTWERRIFPCKEFSVSPMVWMLSAICGALLRQRFIAALMRLP